MLQMIDLIDGHGLYNHNSLCSEDLYLKDFFVIHGLGIIHIGYMDLNPSHFLHTFSSVFSSMLLSKVV